MLSPWRQGTEVATAVAAAFLSKAPGRSQLLEAACQTDPSPSTTRCSHNRTYLVDLGHAVPKGVGPKKSIVAYSFLCQHMGCPVTYQAQDPRVRLPCHQSRYDPERLGSIIQGVAMPPLPRVLLQVKQGAVWAVGVDGLIYGYRNNLHPGKRVGGPK